MRHWELPVERIEFDFQAPIVVPVYLNAHLLRSHVLSEGEQLMASLLVLLMSNHADHFMVARIPCKIRELVASQTYRFLRAIQMIFQLDVDHFVGRNDHQSFLNYSHQ